MVVIVNGCVFASRPITDLDVPFLRAVFTGQVEG